MGFKWVPKEKKATKKGKFAKRIIVGTFTYLFCYTAIVLYLFYKTGSEPSTLTTCIFALLGFEFGVLGKIKIKKESGDNGA